jgi:polar amino acid transport system substrate-binding protein
MTNKNKVMILLLIFSTLTSILTGCDNKNEVVYLNKNTAALNETPGNNDSTPIKVFVHENGFPPFDFSLQESKVTGRFGIYPEIMAEISKRIKIPYERVYLPPGRIYEDFRNGVVNVEFGCSPLWRDSEKFISLYTKHITHDITSIVFRKGEEFPVKSPEALVGKKLGTVIGYIYPSLNEYFKNGNIKREDAPNEKSLMKMLNNNRVDAIIITKTVCQYYAKNLNYNVVIGDTLEDLPLYIRIHENNKDLVEKFNGAIDEMLTDGTINKIYERYK